MMPNLLPILHVHSETLVRRSSDELAQSERGLLQAGYKLSEQFIYQDTGGAKLYVATYVSLTAVTVKGSPRVVLQEH